jgi:hypothetical protein
MGNFMSHNHRHPNPHTDVLHPQSPTDMFRAVIEPTKGQDAAERLGIVTTMRSLMARRPSPELVTFVKDQLQSTTHPQVRAFMQLIISDDQRLRIIAEEGLKLLEHKLQDDQANQRTEVSFPSAETVTAALPEQIQSDPLDTVTHLQEPSASSNDADSMLAALKGFSAHETPPPVVTQPIVEKAQEPISAKVLPFTQPASIHRTAPWHTSQEGVPSISIPTGEDKDSPRKVYSYISSTQAVDRRIAHVAGLVVGIKGQLDVEHGFGFYLPLPDGVIQLDYTGQKRNIIKIAMALPQTIALYDDHRGPHMGGVSNFFTIFEAMRDGYRFLLDLEIIPINGRFALSIQEAIHIDRIDTTGKPAFVSSVHLNKLAHACTAIGFHAFTGEADYNE